MQWNPSKALTVPMREQESLVITPQCDIECPSRQVRHKLTQIGSIYQFSIPQPHPELSEPPNGYLTTGIDTFPELEMIPNP
jgi:hypothetical protein